MEHSVEFKAQPQDLSVNVLLRQVLDQLDRIESHLVAIIENPWDEEVPSDQE